MKIRFLSVSIFAALLAAGCGKKAETSTAGASTSSPPAASTPSSGASGAASSATTGAAAAPAAKSGPARVIEISGNDTMKFSVTTIEAKAGEEITVKLTNAGTLPKEAMGHNFVLLKPGSDVNAFSAAAMTARDTDYVPASLKDQVIAHTKLLGPKQEDSVTFKVPAAGEYPFLCSFPAHAMAGMKGTLVAK
jgi:azurin